MVAASGTGYDTTLSPGQQATAVPILARVIREMESGGKYTARNPNCTGDCDGAGCAGGAYQYLKSTWNGYGGYKCPHTAPAAVQDQRAYSDIASILNTYNGRIWAVPTVWYIGSFDLAKMDTVPMPELGNSMTPKKYGAKWLGKASGYLEPAGIDIWPQVMEGVPGVDGVGIGDIVEGAIESTPVVGDIFKAASDVPGAIAQVASVLRDAVAWVVRAGAWLANPTNWLRIMQVLGGAGLVAGGALILAKDVALGQVGGAVAEATGG